MFLLAFPNFIIPLGLNITDHLDYLSIYIYVVREIEHPKDIYIIIGEKINIVHISHINISPHSILNTNPQNVYSIFISHLPSMNIRL